MSRLDKILQLVSNKALGIQELLSELNENISIATLKRNLSTLVKKQYIVKTGEARASKYQLSPSYQFIREIDLEEYFTVDTYKRVINKNFNSELLKTLVLNPPEIFSQDEKESINKLNQEFKNRFNKLDQHVIKKEYERLCIELAWKSSRIEGNTYSILETETLIKTGIEAKGHSKEEALMILNHKQALDFIQENKSKFKKLDLDMVLALHAELTKKLYIDQGIRQARIGITGTQYRPPANQADIKFYLEEIIKLVNLTEHVLEKALLTLTFIAYLQAFTDGNKRTSRVLANAILIANDFCPISFASVDESEYKKTIIMFYEQNHISPLKKLVLEQFEFSVNNYFL